MRALLITPQRLRALHLTKTYIEVVNLEVVSDIDKSPLPWAERPAEKSWTVGRTAQRAFPVTTGTEAAGSSSERKTPPKNARRSGASKRFPDAL